MDTDALVSALRANKIAGAGLDVLEGEPHITQDHPLLAPELVNKAIVLPHIASATQEAREGMALLTAQNALAALGLRPDGPSDEMPTELR